MNRLVFLCLVIVAFTVSATSVSFASFESYEGSDNLITMTLNNDKANLNVGGKGELTIDWGDGNVEKYTDTVYSKSISHNYSSSSTYTIKITGENILIFACMDNRLTNLDVSKSTSMIQLYCSNNQLTNLDISENTALTTLYLYNNQLTDLDASNNTALSELSCAKNRFTDETLNTLFNTLHSNEGIKVVKIGNNPGTKKCNRGIAESKGWSVKNL